MRNPMPLTAGTRLGPYEILAPIGAGGMGEVYRARDTRLAREVAIKVLPESVANDADRLQRFEQEARAVAALNHPNIMSVHDIGTQDGTHYMVTELLEGETLRERLTGGALPSRRAVECAIQAAQGLAAAHEKGIVHRDLKPENLFITKDGRMKILDFGLAKQTIASTPAGDDLPTLGTTAHTSAGMVVGTVGYMAPEQVKGEAVDSRTDIFAFGAVLYEMLSGRRAFQRTSSVETMAAILKDDPTQLESSGDRQISPGLERIVRRCLEKSPGQRFQSARDLSFAIENLSAGMGQQQAILTTSPARNPWRSLSFALAIIAISALVLSLRGFLMPPPQPSYREVTFRRGYILSAHFTSDGQTIVYSAAWERPPSKLYSSRVDGTDIRALDLPSGDILAVSRSDELAIALGGTKNYGWRGDRLVQAPLGGGAPRELVDNVIGAAWSPGASRLAVARFEGGKCRLEYPLRKVLYETVGWISYIHFSPQGDMIAFMDHPLVADDRGSVAVVDLRGNKRTLTSEWSGEQGLAWSPDGQEIWFTASMGGTSDRALYAVSRKGKQRLVLQGPGSLLLDDIAPDGRVLLAREDFRSEVMIGRTGGVSRQLSWLQYMWVNSLSRDGKFAVMGGQAESSGTDYNIYLARLDGSPAVLLGNGIGGGISPDNNWVTAILPSDTTKVLLLPTGMGDTKSVTAPNFRYIQAEWTSDGRRLVVDASESGHPLRSWVQDVSGGSPRAVTPEGVRGFFVTVNHSDYVSARDPKGMLRLYPIDGGDSKPASGVTDADQVLGGTPSANFLYVTPDDFSTIPLKISLLNIVTGARQPYVALEPTDPAGFYLFDHPVLFTADQKQYVYAQYRALSTLYVVDGLK